MADLTISNDKLKDGRTIAEFIDSEPTSDDHAEEWKDGLGYVKDSINGGMFSKSGYGGVKKLTAAILAPLDVLLGFISAYLSFNLFRKYATNKNLDRFEETGSDILTAGLDGAALVFEVVSTLAIAPILLTVTAGINLLNSFPRMLYYGLQFADYHIGSKKDNRFTEDYQEVKHKFFDKAKDTVVAVVAAVTIGILVTAPFILGAAAIGLAATKVTGLAVAALIAVNVAVGIVSSVVSWFKNKYANPTPAVAAEPTAQQQRETAVYRKAAQQYVETYRQINASTASMTKTLQTTNNNTALPQNKPQAKNPPKLDALDYNYKDLIREMHALGESNPQDAKEYMLALIKEERTAVSEEEIIKERALDYLTDLLANKTVMIDDKRIHTLRDLLNYYQTQGSTQSVFREWLRSTSGMQKVFAVADDYFKNFAFPPAPLVTPDIDPLPTPVPRRALVVSA